VRTTPRGFIPRNGVSPITDHPALSDDHLHCAIEAIITEVTTTGVTAAIAGVRTRTVTVLAQCATPRGSLRRHDTSHDTPRGLLSHYFWCRSRDVSVICRYVLFWPGMLAATGPPRQTLLRGLPVSFENHRERGRRTHVRAAERWGRCAAVIACRPLGVKPEHSGVTGGAAGLPLSPNPTADFAGVQERIHLS